MTAKYKWLPEQPTDEMVNAIMDSWLLSMPENQLRQIYSLLWKAAPEVEQQEPVATCKVSPLKPDRYQREFRIAWKGGQPVEGDLYTNPQPNREPLNAREIKQLLNRDDGLNVTDLVRAVEKAHGVGGE
jgi:hypothetical protein